MKKVDRLKKLKFYVLEEDFNSSKIRNFNIFEHSYIQEKLQELLKKFITYEDFKEKVLDMFRYTYWGRREWEIFIKVRGEENKISVYDQIVPNIDLITKYIIDTYNGGD